VIILIMLLWLILSYSGQDRLAKKLDQIAPQLLEHYKVPGAAIRWFEW